MPQRSVLGPILFTLFISPVSLIASSQSVSQQQYADDTQLYIAISHSDSNSSITSLQSSLLSLYSWFSHNGLALNPDKSDAILHGTSQRISSLGDITCVEVAGTLVTLSNTVKLLGVTLDSNLTFSKHVSSVCQASYYHIRALRHIRHAVSVDMAKFICQALVSSRLNYANGVLYGISNTISRSYSEHRTLLLASFFWLHTVSVLYLCLNNSIGFRSTFT